jgi:hypothetical protein
MNPNRAHQKGCESRDVKITTYGRDQWAVKYDGRPIFTGDVFAVCRWRADLRRLEAK